MRSSWPLIVTVAALVAASLALAALRAAPGEDGDPADAAPVAEAVVIEEHVVIELRVWQRVDNHDDVHLSTHVRGGSGDTIAANSTIAFGISRDHGLLPPHVSHGYRDVEVAGVQLRFWQRDRAPEIIYVRACPVRCAQFDVPVPDGSSYAFWAPLGMVPVPLDDGYGPRESYRHGSVTLAVPVDNPGLAADREYLLALRDALAGSAVLNWSPATPTGEWEGVTLTGAPPRVTGLDLSERGLDGNILGWLGNLTELRELRFDGNALTGTLPSKLATLTKLTHVYLSGNDIAGCVPPPLRSVPNRDLALLRLPECGPPGWLLGSTSREDLVMEALGRGMPTAGTYRWPSERAAAYVIDLPELPADLAFLISAVRPEEYYRGPTAHSCSRPCGLHVLVVYRGDGPPVPSRGSVVLDMDTAQEHLRNRYQEEDPALFAILEQVAASAWTNPVSGDAGEWVWP